MTCAHRRVCRAACQGRTRSPAGCMLRISRNRPAQSRRRLAYTGLGPADHVGVRMALLLGTRRGLEATSSPRGTFAVLALDHRQNLRKELHPEDPASTTADEMIDFKRTVVRSLSVDRDGDAPRSGDRRGPVHRRRVAGGARRLDRRARGHRLRGRRRGPDQPPPARLGCRQGQADGRLGREAARLLPPGRARMPRTRSGWSPVSPPTAGRTTWRSSSSRSRSGSMARP